MTSSVPVIPPEFLDRLSRIVSAEDKQMIESFIDHPRPMSIRITDSSVSLEDVIRDLKKVGYDLQRVPWMNEAILLSPPNRSLIHELESYVDGSLFIQSLSSMAAVEALEIEPGHDVLDCCAAPGGKTSLIRYRQCGQGILVANDLSRRRLQRLRSVLEQHRITDVDLQCQAAESPPRTSAHEHARRAPRVARARKNCEMDHHEDDQLAGYHRLGAGDKPLIRHQSQHVRCDASWTSSSTPRDALPLCSCRRPSPPPRARRQST